jgi:hypothetical protein
MGIVDISCGGLPGDSTCPWKSSGLLRSIYTKPTGTQATNTRSFVTGHESAFRIDFSGESPHFTGTLFDGDLKVTSTSSSLDKGSLVAILGHYLTKTKQRRHRCRSSSSHEPRRRFFSGQKYKDAV